jgi:hypothetical protein
LTPIPTIGSPSPVPATSIISACPVTLEALPDGVAEIFGNADSGISTAIRTCLKSGSLNADVNLTIREGVVEGIIDQIANDLGQFVVVGVDNREIVVASDGHCDVLVLVVGFQLRDHGGDVFLCVHLGHAQPLATGVDGGDVQHVLDQRVQP